MIGDFWTTTANMYNTLFHKPKMSQKLLEKPPFKYIFDIIMETMKQTGYAQGLFSNEELDGNWYDNKDKKMFFLQKIIELTSLVLNEEIVARPIKIVSGQEPQNTNLLLQAIYRAAMSGTNSVYYVEQILAAIGAGPQIFEQAHAQTIKQEIIDSNQSKIIELKEIIFQQQQIIQALKNDLELKDTKIFNLEQQILTIKNEVKQINIPDT
ncbi:unnamed protein product [Paramecium sonneborni]|uniref:TRAF3-interacting protein 1 n=1 Tax=Paramecium sonneborni TaxID=65129 RepID=A0A8S1R3J1_9CILI|nr:unnamed protein product [Paramecium sonneborni]